MGTSISGLLGAGIQVDAVSSSGGFQAYVTVLGATTSDFDSQLGVSQSGAVGEFDAKVCVEIEATKVAPSAQIITPLAVNASGLPPYLVSFSGVGSASGTKNIVAYTWFFNDVVTTASGGESTTHSFNTSGEFLVPLRVTDSDGIVAFDKVRIKTYSGIILEMPQLAISGIPAVGSAPLQVQFGATATPIGGGSIIDYNWSFEHGLSSFRQAPNLITYNTPGNYLPVCTIVDNRGVKMADSVEVGVNN